MSRTILAIGVVALYYAPMLYLWASRDRCEASRGQRRRAELPAPTSHEEGSVTTEHLMWAVVSVATLTALLVVFKAGAMNLVTRLFEQINGQF